MKPVLKIDKKKWQKTQINHQLQKQIWTITGVSPAVKYYLSCSNQFHSSSVVKDLKPQLLQPPAGLNWISRKERGVENERAGEEHPMKRKKNERESRKKGRNSRGGQAAPSGAFVLLAKGPPGAGGNRWHHCVKHGRGGRGLCCLLSPWQQVHLCVCELVRVMLWLPHLCLEVCHQFSFLLSVVCFLLSSLLSFTFCRLGVLANLKMHKQDSSFVTSIPSIILFSPELLSMYPSRLLLFHFPLVLSSSRLFSPFSLPFSSSCSLLFSVFSGVYRKWIDGVPT